MVHLVHIYFVEGAPACWGLGGGASAASALYALCFSIWGTPWVFDVLYGIDLKMRACFFCFLFCFIPYRSMQCRSTLGLILGAYSIYTVFYAVQWQAASFVSSRE